MNFKILFCVFFTKRVVNFEQNFYLVNKTKLSIKFRYRSRKVYLNIKHCTDINVVHENNI